MQRERTARSAAGEESAWTERSQYRSVMWKKRFSSRHQVALGAQWDSRFEKPSTREVFLKLEVALGNNG